MAESQVTTVEELEALPVGSVVRLSPENGVYSELPDGSWEQGAVAEKRLDLAGVPAWFFVGKTLGYRSHQADLLPATVLHHPSAPLVRGELLAEVKDMVERARGVGMAVIPIEAADKIIKRFEES